MTVHEVDTTPTLVCVNHRRRETAVRCGKCGDPICVSCMVQTPVGMRCRSCAQLRRLPQFDVGPWLLVRSTAAGLAASAVAWFAVSYVPYLRFFLAFLVGAVVGEVMSRLAQRRVSRVLEASAVVDVVLGLAIAWSIRPEVGTRGLVVVLSQDPGFLVYMVVPILVASFVAVVKLR